MLPEKIEKLLVILRSKTERGVISWKYYDDEDEVSAVAENFKIRIKYRFDYDGEVGQFTIILEKDNKTYNFATNQNYTDYETVRILFDAAQSSDLDLNDLEP